jgi:hypothetical protein
MSAKFNSEIAVIGIDIGKNSFHVVGLDRRGAIVLRYLLAASRRLLRSLRCFCHSVTRILICSTAASRGGSISPIRGHKARPLRVPG